MSFYARTLTVRGREKFENCFILKFLVYCLITSSVSFNLICGLRYLQLKKGELHRLGITPLKIYFMSVLINIFSFPVH